MSHPGQVVEDPFTAATRYSVVYADPPWVYRDKAVAGNRGVGFKYPLMSDAGIAALPVRSIVADDALLFLWVTWPKLVEALPVIAAWGFEYRSVAFVWVKRSKHSGALAWGMGNWTRANTEPCLLGIRGRPKRVSGGVHQVIEAPLGQHSVKPPETRQRIVQLVGDVPRMELFARQRAPGWDAWGNQVDAVIAPADAGMLALPAAPRVDTGDSGLRQRVVEHGRKHGCVARREVEAMCDLTSMDARCLLQAMVDEGLLLRMGVGRGTVYTLVEG